MLLICETNLALQGKGKFVNRPTVTGGKKYDKYFIYIPTDVVNDSQFPFKAGDEVSIVVRPKVNKLEIQVSILGKRPSRLKAGSRVG